MAETNFNPNPGPIFEVQPLADDGSGSGGSGGSGSGTAIQFLAASDPSGPATDNERLAFRIDQGKMFIDQTGGGSWQPILG